MVVATITGLNPPRFPDEIARLIDVPIYTPEWRTHQCFLMRGEKLRDFDRECVDQKRPLVALWGNSAAASLMNGLRDLQSDHDFGLAEFTASGCQPLLIKSVETDDECLERNRSALARISEAHPAVVLLNALWRTKAEEKAVRQRSRPENYVPRGFVLRLENYGHLRVKRGRQLNGGVISEASIRP